MSRVLVTGRVPGEAIDLLRSSSVEVDWRDEDGAMERSELLRRASGVDAIVALLSERVDDELLDAAGPQLRVVANVAVGYNNIDVAACARRGVIVTNTPGVLTDATADIAMALILMSTRRLGEAERIVRQGRPWRFSMFFHLGSSIQGRLLGIVGMGAIGGAVAARARAHGMGIAYHNRKRVPGVEAPYRPLDELVAEADVLTLHCPYTSETHHLMDARRLALMKPTAFLVNTSRGPVVDEAALVDALRSGAIAGAGLDVYEQEPDVHPGLLELESVVLLPHVGSATLETRTAMATLAAYNVLAVVGGAPPITAVPTP